MVKSLPLDQPALSPHAAAMPYPDPGIYWILVADEPEPARWDGHGWALMGLDCHGLTEARVLSDEPIVFHDAPAD